MDNQMNQAGKTNPFVITIGHEQLRISRRYEALSIFNDFLIAIWFLVGSVFFLSPELTELGTWLFILGSFQFMIRPAIRLARHIHLDRVPESTWEH